jgi:hypothetical protein
MCGKRTGMNGALQMGVPKAEGGTPKIGGPGSSQGYHEDDLNLPDVARSGRWGEWVYYMRGGKQCRRRYVVPRDPRTPKQLCCRAALTAASKAWSESPALMPADRRAWIAAGAKVQSRIRLCQSGPLTGQQHFVGRNCAKGRSDPGMVVRTDGGGGGERCEVRGAKSEIRGSNGVRVCGWLDGMGRLVRRRSTWGQCRGWAGAGPGMGGRGRKKTECRMKNEEWAEVHWSGPWRERWRGG